MKQRRLQKIYAGAFFRGKNIKGGIDERRKIEYAYTEQPAEMRTFLMAKNAEEREKDLRQMERVGMDLVTAAVIAGVLIDADADHGRNEKNAASYV